MATKEQRDELDEKITALVRGRFGGDYPAAFRHYAGGGGLIDRAGLKTLLADAGIGNPLTRWAWVSGVLSAVDRDRDGGISWDEFRAVAEAARRE